MREQIARQDETIAQLQAEKRRLRRMILRDWRKENARLASLGLPARPKP